MKDEEMEIRHNYQEQQKMRSSIFTKSRQLGSTYSVRQIAKIMEDMGVKVTPFVNLMLGLTETLEPQHTPPQCVALQVVVPGAFESTVRPRTHDDVLSPGSPLAGLDGLEG